MTRLALACLLALIATMPVAVARGSLVSEFADGRYTGRVAQGASAGEVTREVRHQRARKPSRYKAPKIKHVPGMVAGLAREVSRGMGPRPRAWCGWWLGRHLGMPDRRLWLARNWVTVGSHAPGPHIGAVVVWRHHVGIITGRQGNQWIVKSGNDGGRVRERARSVAGAIAFRNPHGNS